MQSVSQPPKPARRRDTIRRSRSSLRRRRRCRASSEAGGLCGQAGAFALHLDLGHSRSADRAVWWSPSRGPLRRGSVRRVVVRLARVVGLTPSAVDLVPIAIAPVLRICSMALPALRTDAVEHPFVPREGRKGQPFRAFGAAFMRLLPDHRLTSPWFSEAGPLDSRERFSPGWLKGSAMRANLNTNGRQGATAGHRGEANDAQGLGDPLQEEHRAGRRAEAGGSTSSAAPPGPKVSGLGTGRANVLAAPRSWSA
jgi:hypothetical protein